MVRRILAGLLSVVLLAGTAHAASVEICGNGIDDPLQTGGSANGTKGSCPAGYMDSVVGNGCDLKCPGVDQDDDGYTNDGTYGTAGTTYVDCDDLDERVIPGEYAPDSWTSPTGYKLCQTSGSYGSTTLTATAALCEATNGANCYYIDCSGGSNSNNGTTYNTPFLTLGKVSGGSGGSPPASPITLSAGAVVYLIGSGTCSTTFSDGTYNTIAKFTASGNSSHRITIKNYPGSTATITNSGGPGIQVSGTYYKFAYLNISTQAGASNNGTGIDVRNDYVDVGFTYFHDMGLDGDTNNACLKFEHTDGGTAHHNWFEDCDRSKGNIVNVAALTWLDNNVTAGECQNHSGKWNTIWQSTLDGTNGGDGIKQKHGCLASDVGENKHPIQYNSVALVNVGINWNGSSIRASDNVFSGVPVTTRFFNDSENTPNEDNQLTYNTIVNSSLIRWNNIFYSGSPSLTIAYNVMQDDDSSYAAGNCEGVISIDCYGSDGNKTTFESGSYLSSNNNCFYNPNAALVFNYYADVGSGAAGANYSFANWQGTVGQDANSYNENPTFNTWYQATSSNCSNKGRRYTTSTVTYGGTGIRALRDRRFR